ncbi:MAG TPA: hypothetical protein ENG90_00375 [Gammaproteobacteria bacterium]|nr:hypothetical protein BMS3Abin11_01628 [bacterium BMS3Abin11]GMT40642.1 MAG: hypothetical protein IEMM0001_1377 [bacterium]HDH14935.1 hypothetical protein [Gammaproteobacteria bacterium]
MSDENLMTGSFGLDNDDWQTIFYDEGLPHDWRAAFYSTSLCSVYLPPHEWRKAVENDWTDEVDEDFRFVLQAQSADDLRELTGQKVDFSALVAGVVLEYKYSDEERPRKNEIEELQKLFPVCLDAGPVDHAECGMDKICDSLAVCSVWYPSVQTEPLPSGDFLVTLISNETLPAQRVILTEIEQWMAGQRRAGLFNTCENDAPIRAQETRILAELMGV